MRISLPAVLCVACGIALGLGGYTVQFAKGLSYLSNDPAQCANCHVMREQLDSWQKSSHHGRAVCNDCHTPVALIPKLITKADNGWNHSWRFTMQNYPDPIRIRPVNSVKRRENCLRCHQDLVDEISQPGHSGEVDCVRCHAGAGHGSRR